MFAQTGRTQNGGTGKSYSQTRKPQGSAALMPSLKNAQRRELWTGGKEVFIDRRALVSAEYGARSQIGWISRRQLVWRHEHAGRYSSAAPEFV